MVGSKFLPRRGFSAHVTDKILRLGQSFLQKTRNLWSRLPAGNYERSGQQHLSWGCFLQRAWGELRRQLTFKLSRTNTHLVLVELFFPSTKRCSTCGQSKASNALYERRYRCDGCGLEIDRDVHTVIHLAQYAEMEHRASPRVRGQDKTSELGKCGEASVSHRTLPPQRAKCSLWSLHGTTAGLSSHVEAPRGSADFVNAPHRKGRPARQSRRLRVLKGAEKHPLSAQGGWHIAASANKEWS